MSSMYYAILKEFKTKWERRYPGRTFTPRPYHFRQLKDLLTPVEGFEPVELTEVVARINIYLNNKFYQVCAHNFSKFIEHFDTFIPPAPKIPVCTNVCTKCGVLYRLGDNHICSVVESGYRTPHQPMLLSALLPQQPKEEKP
jgi:hypothetical protein